MKGKYFIMSLVCLFLIAVICFKQSQSSQEDSQEPMAVSNQMMISNSISQIDSFNDIRAELNSVDKDTLVIFAVDEVLITYSDMVLRPCGRRFRFTCWKDIDPKEVSYLTSIMLNASKMILVDPSLPRLISKLESRGVKTMALTSTRTGKFGIIDNVEDLKLKALKQLNLDFSKSFPQSRMVYFKGGARKEKDYSVFKNGVLFIGDDKGTKGSLLVQFLDKIQWTPKRVILIDDKMSHIACVESALNEINIPFQGYQYKGGEKLPGEFNEKVAELQFSFLRKDRKWLSDAEVRKEEKGLFLSNEPTDDAT